MSIPAWGLMYYRHVEKVRNEQPQLRDGRLYLGSVASRVDLIDNRILRSDLPLDRADYMRIGSYSDGVNGLHYVVEQGNLYTAIVDGNIFDEGKKFGILRTIRHHGLVDESTIDEAVLGTIFDQETRSVYGGLSKVNRQMRKFTK